MKKVEKEVKEVEVESKEVKVLKLDLEDVNQFMAIMDVILLGDDRLKPLRAHFVEILKRNNEKPKEQ